MRRILYLVRETIANIWANRMSVAIGVVTTAFTIACFGVFFLLYWNVKNLARSLQDEIQVMVYLKPDTSKVMVSGVRRYLEGEHAVASVAFISEQEAVKDFHQQFPEESSLLDGMGDTPLPASFVVTLAPGFQSSELVEGLAERVREVPGVEFVRYSRDWIDTLGLFVSYLEIGALVIGLILAVATVTIIANTIRLSFYARKKEIEILRLIGATGSFIAVPYVVEGAFLGVVGGGLSLALLKGGFEVFRFELDASGWFQGLDSVIVFFPLQISILLVVTGFLLGSASSLLSVYGLLRSRV